MPLIEEEANAAGAPRKDDAAVLAGKRQALTDEELATIAAKVKALPSQKARYERFADLLPEDAGLDDMRRLSKMIAEDCGKSQSQLIKAFKKDRREKGVVIRDSSGGNRGGDVPNGGEGGEGAAPDLSEDAIATEFVARYGGEFLFDHTRGKWYRWTGTFWEVNEIGSALDRSRRLSVEMAAERREDARDWGKRSIANAVAGMAANDPLMATTSERWDPDEMLLGTPEGTVDLRTGELRAASPDERITRQTLVAPQSGKPERWLKFLDEVTGGDAELIYYLQQIFGYCLTGLTTEQVLFFIYGEGQNGKGVFLNVTTKLLGEYATTAPMDTFNSTYGERHPTDLAMLKGRRMVTASETKDDKYWDESRIKNLTGGDPITARFMRQDFFTFQPEFKLLIIGNHVPRLINVDVAMRRRLRMIPFRFRPQVVDIELEKRLLAEEAAQILNWGLEGCANWQEKGLVTPQIVLDSTDAYFDEQDSFRMWLSDCCDTSDPNAKTTPSELFASWKQYAKNSNIREGSIIAFGKTLKRNGFENEQSSDRRYFGIRLKPDRPSSADSSDPRYRSGDEAPPF